MPRKRTEVFPKALRTTALAAALISTSVFPAPVGGSGATGVPGKWVTVLLTSTTLTTWSPPVYPTLAFISGVGGGGGGGGKPTATGARGGGGGGGAQYCLRRPFYIVSSAALDYICGTGGNGGSGVAGSAGGPSYFGYLSTETRNLIYLNGGLGGASSATSDGGQGGGWIPATAPTAIGSTPGHAVRLQITHWAGPSGGCGGEASGQTSGLAGEVEAIKSAAAGAAANGSGGGGPGGGSIFGAGAPGTTGSATAVNGTAATNYGTGGSGANGASTVTSAVGGAGAQGAFLVCYWDPNGDSSVGWQFDVLGGAASADAGSYTPTQANTTLLLYGTAAGASAGSRNTSAFNSSGAGGAGEYCLGLPYNYTTGSISYSCAGETAAGAAGNNDGVDGGDLGFGHLKLKGGKAGLRGGTRTGGAGGGRNGGGGGAAGGGLGSAAGVTTAPNSNPAGLFTNGGAGGGGGGSTTGHSGGAGAPCEASRSADGGNTAGGSGPGAPGGGCSWMATGGLGQNYGGAGFNGLDAYGPGAGGGGCGGATGTNQQGGKGGPACLVVMYWKEP